MKNIKKILSLLLILQIQQIYTEQIESYKALCIVPVADLISQPFSIINPKVDVKEEYKKIPISGEKGFLNCPRLHQLIFNEQVEVIKEFKDEVMVRISTVFAHDKKTNNVACTYCTLKENLIPLSQIKDLTLIPAAIDFKSTTFEIPEKNIITLILPYYDEITKKTYSVGTRFVFSHIENEDFIVSIYDTNNNNFSKSKINKKFAIESLYYTKEERIKNFVNLLKLWTQTDIQFIPYNWGGISLLNFAKRKNFNIVKGTNCLGNEIIFYRRDDALSFPLTGFDCSNLISRAAQICQIPYFYKNTTTIERCLKPLSSDESIEEGDLVWFPGHIMIIADINKNIFIEARGYNSGYGKVHQITIDKFFKGINNFQELKDAYFKNQTLMILNKVGNVSLKINNFKILKFKSVWR